MTAYLIARIGAYLCAFCTPAGIWVFARALAKANEQRREYRRFLELRALADRVMARPAPALPVRLAAVRR